MSPTESRFSIFNLGEIKMTSEISEKITTKQVARFFGVEATSIRSALSIHGHYWGLKPLKAPSGRLVWDRAEVEARLEKPAA